MQNVKKYNVPTSKAFISLQYFNLATQTNETNLICHDLDKVIIHM